MAIEIPGYRIIRQIGAGGMATVYLAIQEALDREVALKVMAQQVTGQDAQFEERFIREGKSIAQLTHHSIVGVFDMGSVNGNFYIAMEYLNGGSLKDKIQAGLTAEESLQIIKAIAISLGFAHSKGYVHRDVKPMNILFREDGTPILTDFGIAKIVLDTGSELTTTGLIMGTPSYMSPEQAKGEVADGRSDLYSLGIVLHEMFIGKVPYTADTAIAVLMKHVNDNIPLLPSKLSQYQFLLDKLLAKNPNERFQSAQELISAIDNKDAFHQETEIRPAITHSTHQTTFQDQSKKSSSMGKVIGSVLTLAVLAGGGYFGYDYWQQQNSQKSDEKLAVTAPESFKSLQVSSTKAEFKQLEKDLSLFSRQHAYHHLTSSLEIDLIARYLDVVEEKMAADLFSDAESILSLALVHHANDGKLVAMQKMLAEKIEDKNQPQITVAEIKDTIEKNPEKETIVETKDPVDPIKTKLDEAGQLFLSSAFNSTNREKLLLILKDVEKQDPNNEIANNLRQKMADEYLIAAEKARRVKDFHVSHDMIKKGLSIQSTHKDLLLLKAQVTDEQSSLIAANAKKQKMQALLTEAKQLQATDPTSQRLIELYQRMLADDPSSTKAILGLEKVLSHLKVEATELSNVEQYSQSLLVIQRGLNVKPGDTDLMRMKRNIESMVANQQQQQNKKAQIASLLKKAEQYHQELMLVGPKEDAFDMYQEILSIEPTNQAAKIGLRKIADQLEELAKVRLSVDDRSASMALVKKGLTVYPRHQGLQSLQKKLKQNNNTIFAPFSGTDSSKSHNNGPDIIFSN